MCWVVDGIDLNLVCSLEVLQSKPIESTMHTENKVLSIILTLFFLEPYL